MFLIGVAGGSGSGKTTFAKKIISRIQNYSKKQEQTPENIAIIHQDSYYLPELPMHLKTLGEPNFDHPDAFDWSLLFRHVDELKEGKDIQVPHYDFKTSSRMAETTTVHPHSAVIVEGIYTLWDSKIRNLFDIKIYLNVEADIRFIRRLHRDVKERGRSLDGIIRQYYDSVRPMHREFLEPTKQFADIIVGEETDIAADVIAARVIQLMLNKKMGK